ISGNWQCRVTALLFGSARLNQSLWGSSHFGAIVQGYPLQTNTQSTPRDFQSRYTEPRGHRRPTTQSHNPLDYRSSVFVLSSPNGLQVTTNCYAPLVSSSTVSLTLRDFRYHKPEKLAATRHAMLETGGFRLGLSCPPSAGVRTSFQLRRVRRREQMSFVPRSQCCRAPFPIVIFINSKTLVSVSYPPRHSSAGRQPLFLSIATSVSVS
ncbi:hypothetical protein CH063_00679, partial [Colletotrichum higginsianum]